MFTIRFYSLWLAKISITPSMKENNPVLVEKLVEYQLKAKDVLAAAFLPTYSINPTYQYPVTPAAFKLECEQLGIELPADFVEVPIYEQLSFNEIVTR